MSLFGDETIEDDFEEGSDSVLLTPGKENGLQSPQQSNFFISHEEVENNILSLWNSGRMPHALIFNGIKGIGKATFAYRLARFILKESGATNSGGLFGDETAPEILDIPSDHTVFSKIASGGHPDLFTVSRPFDEKTGQFKNDIPVDDIRKVAPFLRKTSSDGGWRVVIIDDANLMNRNGQNALLKILEEPPKNALLILVTHGAGGLLPTIRSRCRFIPFNTLNEEALGTLLEKASEMSIMPGDKDVLMAMSEGSAGQAIELMNEGGIEAATILLGALGNISNMTENQIDTLALSYGKSGDKKIIEKFTFIIDWWLDTVINMAVHNETNRQIGVIEIARPKDHGLHSLLRLKEDIDNHIRTCLNGNLDKRYMIYKTLRMIQK